MRFCLYGKVSPPFWLSRRACVDCSVCVFLMRHFETAACVYVCEQRRGTERGKRGVFLDLLRLCEYGPERLSNKHTQSLKGFQKQNQKIKKEERKERKTSEYLHHRGEEGVFVIGFCSAFVFFIAHSLTVTCLHSSIHPETQYSWLNSVSDRDAMSYKYH